MARLHLPVTIIYSIGSLCALNKYTIKDGKKVFVTICCFFGLLFSFILKKYITQYYFEILFEPLFMIGLLCMGYDVIDSKYKICRFPDVFNVLFFVYCIHLIVLCWSGGIMWIVLGNKTLARLISYFILWLTFFVDVWMANIIKNISPKIYTLIAGGR